MAQIHTIKVDPYTRPNGQGKSYCGLTLWEHQIDTLPQENRAAFTHNPYWESCVTCMRNRKKHK